MQNNIKIDIKLDKVCNALDGAIENALEEAIGELESQTKKNTKVRTGKTKASWQHKVDSKKGEAYVALTMIMLSGKSSVLVFTLNMVMVEKMYRGFIEMNKVNGIEQVVRNHVKHYNVHLIAPKTALRAILRRNSKTYDKCIKDY